jgi:high-affinity nickel-transport protein
LLGLGLLLGIRHAADPDHVVAVGVIATRTRGLWPAARLGVLWGAGHTVTLFIVASGIILFNLVVPPRLGLALEFTVAIALVTLGLINVRSHSHSDTGPDDASGGRRAFTVGLVHGLAGSAAVALLVVATVNEPWWACAYLLVFGAGTLAGMTLITTGVAWPLAAAAGRWRASDQLLRMASGTMSVAFGLWLVYEIGWSDGLFLATPTWTPH